MKDLRVRPRSLAGFSLIELAVVLLVVGLLLAGVLIPLSAQLTAKNVKDTTNTLLEIREAIIGFAAANGRLPCPAKADLPTDTGIEDPVGTGDCSHSLNGYVPAATLGIGPTDSQGFALDAWGNRIRYSVTTVNNKVFTKPGKIKQTGIAGLNPDLKVCSVIDSVGANCASNHTLASGAAAVVFSQGRRGGGALGGTDETENTDADNVFVSHEEYAPSADAGEFDDILIWISPYILFSRLIAAGQLP
jgi:prepilin-type N-terminal cleavage/methylation domain-containing protein